MERRRAAIKAVVAASPRFLDGWARLGETAADRVDAYAYFRVGYHRGLDQLRQAGWRVATHGYERDRAYQHLGSSTFAKFALNLDQDLRNGLLFHARWDDTIRNDANRERKAWWRTMRAPALWSAAVNAVSALVRQVKGQSGPSAS